MNKSQQLVHFVSTGPGFPYIYYIGVMTALKVYGGKVRLWITEEPQSKYFKALKDKVKIIRIPAKDIPDFPVLVNKDPYFKRVAIFDYLIWDIVYKFGGMIMGLDSITLKSHFDLLEPGKELMASKIGETNSGLFFFMMHGSIVRKGSKLARLIINDAKVSLNSSDMKRVDSGMRPFENRCRQNLDKISISPLGVCTSFVLNIFMDFAIPCFDMRTIALAVSHYYALPGRSPYIGLPIDENYVAEAKSLYARLVKEMLSEEEWRP